MQANVHSDDVARISVTTCAYDGTEAVVKLGDYSTGVAVWLTPEQADTLYNHLGAWLQDRQRQAHPETCEDGSPVLQVDDSRPVTLSEITAAMRRGETISDEEIVRRAGF